MKYNYLLSYEALNVENCEKVGFSTVFSTLKIPISGNNYISKEFPSVNLVHIVGCCQKKFQLDRTNIKKVPQGFKNYDKMIGGM